MKKSTLIKNNPYLPKIEMRTFKSSNSQFYPSQIQIIKTKKKKIMKMGMGMGIK